MSRLSIIGIILILAGAFVFVYPHYSYTQKENVAQLGDLKVTVDNQKTGYFPPELGGLLIAAGVIVLIFGSRGR